MSGICSRHQGHDPKCDLCSHTPYIQSFELKNLVIDWLKFHEDNAGYIPKRENEKAKILREKSLYIIEHLVKG